jgi:uncharacterized membrane protein YfhO
MDLLCDILYPMVWPLCFLLVTFVVLRKLNNSIEPIFQGMTGTLKVQATKYAMAWAMACMYAAAASLNALGEVAEKLNWLYVAAFAKVTQPAVVAVIAYVNKSPDNTEGVK